MGFYYIMCAVPRMLSKIAPLTGFRSAARRDIPCLCFHLCITFEICKSFEIIRLFVNDIFCRHEIHGYTMRQLLNYHCEACEQYRLRFFLT